MDHTIEMNGQSSFRRFAACSLFLYVFVTSARCQVPLTAKEDPFRQAVPALQLKDQSIVDGVAQLGQIGDLAVAVEFPLGSTISAPAPPPTMVTGTVGPGTLASALDALCSLDQAFAWQRIGNTVHLFPRALEKDQSYLFNRKIETLTFQDVPGAQEAVFAAVAQLTGPKQQIAVLQTGISINFSHSWTASFKDVTVREAFDKIAQQLGPTYGWQFSGAADFRIITFHERLSVRSKKVTQPL
jgi:hypothetical protein